MRVHLRPSIRATVIALVAAPGLAAQQSGGGLLHTANAMERVPLFPRSIGSGAAVAPSRFEVLTRQIDSVGAVGGRMQIAAAAREQIAQRSTRFLLLAQVARGLQRRTDASRTGVRMDWISAVTVAGVTQLGRTSLFASGESSPSIWRSLRNDGQFAGLATITGGASWLLSNLALHAARFGVPHSHITAGATHSH